MAGQRGHLDITAWLALSAESHPPSPHRHLCFVAALTSTPRRCRHTHHYRLLALLKDLHRVPTESAAFEAYLVEVGNMNAAHAAASFLDVNEEQRAKPRRQLHIKGTPQPPPVVPADLVLQAAKPWSPDNHELFPDAARSLVGHHLL